MMPGETSAPFGDETLSQDALDDSQLRLLHVAFLEDSFAESERR
jgi:hypothetical protein